MPDVGLNWVVSANVQNALDGIKALQRESQLLGTAIDRALDKGQDASQLEDAFQRIQDKIKALRATVQDAKPPLDDMNNKFKATTLSTGQMRVAFIDLGRVITGQGFSLRSLASNFTLLGPAVTVGIAALYGIFEALNKTTDAQKKTAEQAKALQGVLANLKTGQDVSTQATGGQAGDIARVQLLATAIQDVNKSYAERQRALQELQATNKSYFGDLTLEASSLATLAQRVKDYSDALVTEAIIKGQTDEIAKMTSELLKQVKVQDQLKDARDRAINDQKTTDVTPTGGGIGTVGGTNISEQTTLASAVTKATDAYNTQRDAVEKIREAIASYNSELNQNIGIQLKQRPLGEVKPETTKNLDELLDKIRQVKAELAKPAEGSLFSQNKLAQEANAPGNDISQLFHDKIADAIAKGAKDGTTRAKEAAAELANLYAQQLSRIQNPNLRARIPGTVVVKPEEIDDIDSQVSKAFGDKGLKIRIPIDITDAIKSEGFNKGETQKILQKAAEDALNGLPPIRWNAKIQLVVDTKTLADDFHKQLIESLNSTVNSSATSGLADIGKALGAAIAKGQNPIQAAGDAILGSIGSLMEQLGEALIKYGVEMELIHDIFSAGLSISPIAAIAAGIALTAAGELIKKSFKATAFAEGGIVTGPTYGLIGEAGPEAIFPLSKINDFIGAARGGGAQTSGGGELTSTIKGQDMLIVLSRAQKNANLVGKPS